MTPRSARARLDAASSDPVSALALEVDPATPVTGFNNGIARLTDGRYLINRGGAAAGLVSAQAEAALASRIAFLESSDFDMSVRRAIPDAIAQFASGHLCDAHPGMCARQSRRRFAIALCALGAGAAGLIALAGLKAAALAAGLSLSLLFIASIALTLLSALQRQDPASAEAPLEDEALPAYAVIAPLCREAAVVPKLLRALRALRYPRDRLEVRFVIEEDDIETREALAAAAREPWMRVIIAPPGAPRTKPRALNAALLGLNASLVVVYDAEDEPEPDQLLRAAAAFARQPPETACLQARLSIDNTFDSLLTQLFTIEYAALFDVCKPGIARLRLPLPLGGTSNHFRLSALRAAGGWDAWNVTEDADLGIRLARLGFGIADLNSTTFEEAPAGLKQWLSQRKRWLKGWVQTACTHFAEPRRVLSEIGWRKSAAAFVQIASTVLASLGFPLLAGLFIWRIADGSLFSGTYFEIASDTVSAAVFAGGIVCIYLPAFIGCYRRRLAAATLSLPLLPVYCLMIAAAAWLAVFELLAHPFRWNKTEHGLARSSRLKDAANRPVLVKAQPRFASFAWPL